MKTWKLLTVFCLFTFFSAFFVGKLTGFEELNRDNGRCFCAKKDKANEIYNHCKQGHRNLRKCNRLANRYACRFKTPQGVEKVRCYFIFRD